MTTVNIIEFFHKAIENVKKRFYTLTKEYTLTSMTNSSSSSFLSSFKSNVDFMIRTMEGHQTSLIQRHESKSNFQHYFPFLYQ